MRSIFFSEHNRKLTIENKKHETRRTHGLDVINEKPSDYCIIKQYIDSLGYLVVEFAANKKPHNVIKLKSRYNTSEKLYIAEPMYIKRYDSPIVTPLEKEYYYLYDVPDIIKSLNKKEWYKVSPMYMRQCYGRSFIQILNIQCQKVQDISYDSCIAEGIMYNSQLQDNKENLCRAEYATMFDKINEVGDWAKNVYVFVYRYAYLPDYKRRAEK